MPTIQPSSDSRSSLADWWDDAIALVQRIDYRLRPEATPVRLPRLRHGRKVLTDRTCLDLAGLSGPLAP